MSKGRITGVLAGVVALALLAGCSGSDQPATLSANAQWADGVCVAGNDLRTSIGSLNDSLSFDSSSGQSAVDQVRQQVQDRFDAVKQNADQLKTAVGAVPPDASASVQKAQGQLQTQLDAVQKSVTAAAQAVVGVKDATTAQELAVAVTAAVTVVATAASDVLALRSTAAGFASTANKTVSEAFSQAPACSATSSP